MIIRISRETLRYLWHVCSSVCPFVCISVAHTGRISVKFCTWDLHVHRRDTPNLIKIGENLLQDYLSTFSLLTEILNILQLDNSAKEIHCCIYMANLNTCIFLTPAYTSPAVKSKVLLPFHSKNCNVNTPPFYVIRTLPIL